MRNTTKPLPSLFIVLKYTVFHSPFIVSDSIRYWRLMVSDITSHFSQKAVLLFPRTNSNISGYLMFIGPCIIVIVEEWKTNLLSLAILFQFLCAQRVSDINMPIFRSLRLCWWITTSVGLFSVRCVLELLVRLQNEHHQISAAQKAPTHNELRTRRPMW